MNSINHVSRSTFPSRREDIPEYLHPIMHEVGKVIANLEIRHTKEEKHDLDNNTTDRWITGIVDRRELPGR